MSFEAISSLIPTAEAVRPWVAAHARRTPMVRADELSERLGRACWLKLESLQETGSFKVRGAAARLGALSAAERTRGVVACSSGNHGRAVAFVADRMGIPATIHVPIWVDPTKLAGMRDAGAHVVCEGETFDEAEEAARRKARTEGRPYVSAYDDPWVIAGQGTLAQEILDDCDQIPDAIVVPLSGGGLIGGIALELRRMGADSTRCVGVSAQRARVMLESVRAGSPVELPEEPTLANALAGGIGPANAYSFALVRELVTQHEAVPEDQIAAAMRYAIERLRLVVEGGGAVGLAAALGAAPALTEGDGPVVILVSGGNVAAATLVDVLRGDPS